MKLVFATNNTHKLDEARKILGTKAEILSLNDINCHADIPETADTLEGNSLLKARYIYERFGMNCFADDTGLEIDVLNGAPGVYSARYAGEHGNSAANRQKVLQAMSGEANRKARFRTIITLLLNGKEYQFEGIAEGNIISEEQGENGFGYDSIFMPEGYNRTFAELESEEKNRISHRGKAMEAFWTFIKHTNL